MTGRRMRRVSLASILPGLALLSVLCGSPAVTSVHAQDPPPSLDDPVDYFDARQRALELAGEGRFDAATPLLEALTRSYPDDSELWARLAEAHAELDRPGRAIEAARRALELGTRYDSYVMYTLARLHAAMGEPDSAFVWLDRSLAARWEDRPGIAGDPAFESLADDPRFGRITGAPERELTRDEGWRHDLAYLVEEARRMHAGPDRPAFAPAFDSAAAALHARIPELSNDRILLELERIVVQLGDGHSGIYGPDPDSPLEFEAGSLPLLFYAFEEGIYVVDAAEDARRWIGSEVVAFGPRPAADVAAELPAHIHHENEMTVQWLGVRFMLPTLAFLHAVGATDGPGGATLTLRDPAGEEHRVTFDGGEHLRTFLRKLRPPSEEAVRAWVRTAEPSSPPLYLRDVDANYWLEPLPEHDAVYFQFNQVRDLEGGPTIAAFADTLRRELERRGASHLIVDVRHNNGGNNGLLRPLVHTLVWWEQDAPGRRIFVITGRNTFSAAQNFINRIERWTDALFVGEPSSSRPNFAGEETNLLLPYSRVRGSISTRYWQDSDPGDNRSWIAPRVPVRLTADDYFSNRDPALETIFRIIAARQGSPPAGRRRNP